MHTGRKPLRQVMIASCAALALTAAGCTGSTFGNDNVFSGIDTTAPARNADLSARKTRPLGNDGNIASTQNSRNGGGSTIRYDQLGDSQISANRPIFAASANGKQYDLNLENTDISAASKVIFSDILKTGYSIDPRVQGNISLSTGRPIPVDHLLVYFENALRYANAAVVKDPLGYKVVPLFEANVSPNIDDGGASSVQAGFGVSVVPLLHVSADSIIPLIDNFVTRQGLVKVDKARNALLFQGTSAERRAAMEAVLSFDQEWLSKQSVGIYRIQSTNPTIIIREVEEILQTKEGARGADLVRMVPVERLNGVMIVAKTSQLMNKTIQWLERLDRNDFDNVGIKVYQVQYADATKLANTLSSMFLGAAATSTGLDATSQFPPDSLSAGTDVAAVDGEQKGLSPTTGNSNQQAVTASSSQDALLQNVRISADPTNNTILVYADNEKYRIIERAIASLDRRPLQVAIETTIAEIKLNNELRHGVQFFLKSNDLGLGSDKGSSGLTSGLSGTLLSRIVPGYNLLVGPEGEPRVILDALRNITEVNVLSQPSLVVRDNSVATLQIGDEVPITTQTSQSTTTTNAPVINSISFRDTGVILSVRPRISSNGVISMDIKQEISSVVENANSASLTPTISQRKLESTLSVQDGQTVFLGGLVDQQSTSGSSGIPALGDLPKWGDLFSRKNKKLVRTELILLIKPRIIRDSEDASSVANEMRSRLLLMNRQRETTPLRVPAESVLQ